MLKKALIVIGFLGLLAGVVPHIEETLHAATCTGASPCNACKNCSACGLCAKRGGTCGVCKR